MKTKGIIGTLHCMCKVEKEHKSKSNYKNEDNVRKEGEETLIPAYRDEWMQEDSVQISPTTVQHLRHAIKIQE